METFLIIGMQFSVILSILLVTASYLLLGISIVAWWIAQFVKTGYRSSKKGIDSYQSTAAFKKRLVSQLPKA